MIDINFTLGIQVVNFFIMLWFLNRFIFKPILKTVDERESKIKDLEDQARSATEKLDEATGSYDKGVLEIHRESAEIVAVSRKDALKTATEMQEKARREYKAKVDQAVQEIQKEVDKVSSDLKKDIGGFAETLATKILGRQVG